MAEHIYRLAEIVGTSPNGVDDAIRNAVSRASQHLRNIDWFEMTEIRGHLPTARWPTGRSPSRSASDSTTRSSAATEMIMIWANGAFAR